MKFSVTGTHDSIFGNLIINIACLRKQDTREKHSMSQQVRTQSRKLALAGYVSSNVVSQVATNKAQRTIFKQYAKTNSARDLKNWIKNGRFPLAFSTFQLNNFQNCEVGNPRDSAIKQSRVCETRKANLEKNLSLKFAVA